MMTGTDIIPSCQDLHHAPENSSVDPTQQVGGTRDGVHDVRHELNLLAGSLVTVAYGFIGSGVGVKTELKLEMDRDSASSTESLE